MTDRIYIGRTADTLADGRPLGFGDEVSLDADGEKANQHLIDTGVLPEKPEPTAQKVDDLKVPQLKALAAVRGIEDADKKNRGDLVDALGGPDTPLAPTDLEDLNR